MIQVCLKSDFDFLQKLWFSETFHSSLFDHPCMDENSFIEDYMEPLNDKLQAENKQLFIAGDFNFDMLKNESSRNIKIFWNYDI